MFTLRCLINGGSNKRGLEIFVKFNKQGVKINGCGGGVVGVSKNLLTSVMNEKKKHKCLILMLNYKVSKQARTELVRTK